MRFLSTTISIAAVTMLTACSQASIECDSSHVQSEIFKKVSSYLESDPTTLNFELRTITDHDPSRKDSRSCSAVLKTGMSFEDADKMFALAKEVDASIKLDSTGFPVTRFVPNVKSYADIQEIDSLPAHIKLAVFGSSYFKHVRTSFQRQTIAFYGDDDQVKQVAEMAATIDKIVDDANEAFKALVVQSSYVKIAYNTRIIKEDGNRKVDVKVRAEDNLSELEDRLSVVKELKKIKAI